MVSPWGGDYSDEAQRLFTSFLVVSALTAAAAGYGWHPPDPNVHWPGHGWIHFMKRAHVIMSIGSFLLGVCASAFSLFALHRVLAGGFNTRAPSTAALLVRELEFEFVAVCSYFFAGAMLLMGPVAIRCFCMVQQGLRSTALAAAVCCLIVGIVLLILSFFNAHLSAFPYDSFEDVMQRFVQLSLARCSDGGRPALLTILAWMLQLLAVALSLLSLVETFPSVYYRDLLSAEQLQAEELAQLAPNSDSFRSVNATPDVDAGGSEEGDDTLGRLPLSLPEMSRLRLPGAGARLASIPGSPGGAPGAFEGVDDGAGARPVHSAHRRVGSGDGLGTMRLSPVTAGAPSSTPSSALPLQHPWDLAMLTTVDGNGVYTGLPAGLRARPVHNSHRRVGSGGAPAGFSKVSSVASSMVSLDSNVVD